MNTKQRTQIAQFLRTDRFQAMEGNGCVWVIVDRVSCYFYFDADDNMIDFIVD